MREDECGVEFRFKKDDIFRLAAELHLPEVFRCQNGVFVDIDTRLNPLKTSQFISAGRPCCDWLGNIISSGIHPELLFSFQLANAKHRSLKISAKNVFRKPKSLLYTEIY